MRETEKEREREREREEKVMFRTYLWCDVPSKPVATFSGKKSHAPALVDSHSYTQQMASNEGKHLGEKRMIWRIIWGKY